MVVTGKAKWVEALTSAGNVFRRRRCVGAPAYRWRAQSGAARGVGFALHLALAVVATCGADTYAASPYRYGGVERVVALSDPHGDYDATRLTLEHAGVIDDNGRWSGGESYLIFTGDLLDRGPDSRAIMDLLMDLEVAAERAGGRVLVTLGNHEVMNLAGDLRYVSREEYAAFADDESSEQRERAYRRWLARQPVDDRASDGELRQAFDRDRPPGFFAHRQAFSGDGRYGRWLLEKPVMVVVNDTAYVHAGMPALVADYGLERLNDSFRQDLAGYLEALETLYANGDLDPASNFYDHPAIAQRLLSDGTVPGSDAQRYAALQSVLALNAAPLHSAESPLWYRGTAGCGELTEGDILAASLAAVGARRVVIGHTPTPTRGVLTRFDGRVIAIDTGMYTNAYGGSGHALIVENGELQVAREHQATLTAPRPQPRRVGNLPKGMSSEALAELLRVGTVASVADGPDGAKLVQIEHAGNSATAAFYEAEGRRDYSPPLAAYRMDLLLGLDLVPVTVARDIDGEAGALQFIPLRMRSERERVENREGGGAWCPLSRQWQSMLLFDALIDNRGRSADNMLYSPHNWQLVSMDHRNAFGTASKPPAQLRERDLTLTEAWREALKALSGDALEAEFGGILSGRQLRGLEQRADYLLR